MPDCEKSDLVAGYPGTIGSPPAVPIIRRATIELKHSCKRLITCQQRWETTRPKKACAQFIELCRRLGLLAKASVAIDGSKFQAVNNRDKNFTQAKIEHVDETIE